MGTMLYGRGVFLNVCYDELTLKQPDLVREIHRDYVKAGAELIETNTFGANPIKLAQYGLGAETERINGPPPSWPARPPANRAAVLGAIGPLGVRIEPFGEIGRQEAGAAFARQVDGLLAGGVDGFILETFSDVDELRAAFSAVRRTRPAGHRADDGRHRRPDRTTAPTRPPSAPILQAMGADVIGVNCSVGPHGVLEAVEKLARVVTVPLSAQPNAGLPRDVGDRKIYMASPEYMAEYARRIVEAGARFVGGCCGTTPEHIKAIVGFVQSVSPTALGSTARDADQGRPLEPDPAGRALPPGRQAGAGRVHHHGGDRSAQGSRSGTDVRAGAARSRPPAWTRSTFPTAPGPRAGWARCSRR